MRLLLELLCGIGVFDIEKTTNNCLENPISLLQSIKLPYSEIRIIGTVMTGRIGIRELSQIVIIGSLKLSEI